MTIPSEGVSYSCAGVSVLLSIWLVLPKYLTACVVQMISLRDQLNAVLQQVPSSGPQPCQSSETPRGVTPVKIKCSCLTPKKILKICCISIDEVLRCAVWRPCPCACCASRPCATSKTETCPAGCHNRTVQALLSVFLSFCTFVLLHFLHRLYFVYNNN